MSSTISLLTIGAHGYTEVTFYQALQAAGVDTFCDLRRRRGMRGALYAFANSKRLQTGLRARGIRYLHLKSLAPSVATRNLQHSADKSSKVGSRQRTALSPSYIAAYQQECLTTLESGAFLAEVGAEARIVALFCVERLPDACHRSLVAAHLAPQLGIEVHHLMP